MSYPFGLSYAYGAYEVRNAVPASAFSRGDPLMLTSASSLSGSNILFAAGQEIAGVALSASTESYRDRVPYLVWQSGTVFWSRVTAGSTVTPGEEFDFELTSAIYMVTTSQLSSRVVIVRDTQELTPVHSNESFVLVQPLVAGGEGEWE